MTKSRSPFPYSSEKPLLVVISGPSGVGKDAAIEGLKELGRPYHFTVTATTRQIRPGERDGIDYIFLDTKTFQDMIREDALLEWAVVYGHSYGVPRAQVKKALGMGKVVIVKTDVQGAATIKSLAPDGVFIFLAPPSMEVLERRLKERKSDSSSSIATRIFTARQEMERLKDFDSVVVNQEGRLEEAVSAIDAIITAERSRARPRDVRL